MKFYFADWQAFWAMGNHGFYVWACYAAVFVILLILSLQPSWQLSRLKHHRKIIVQRKQQTLSVEGKTP